MFITRERASEREQEKDGGKGREREIPGNTNMENCEFTLFFLRLMKF